MSLVKAFDLAVSRAWAAYVRARFKNVELGRDIVLHGLPTLKIPRSATVTIGDGVVLTSRPRSNPVGLNRRCSIALESEAELTIGRESGFSGVAIFCAERISIGAHVTCGGNVSIWDTDFHPLGHLERRRHQIEAIRTAPIEIGDDVFLGAGVLVLKGATIGARAVIGAGSVVSGHIDPDSVCAGVPARPLAG